MPVIESPVFNGAVRIIQATAETHKPGSITNTEIASATGIDYDKLDHMQVVQTAYDTIIAGAPVNYESIVFVARSTGRIEFFYAGMNSTGATNSITCDCLVNGTSILRAAVTVANTDTDRENIQGDIKSPILSAGDIVSMKLIDATSNGTGPFSVAGIYYQVPS